MIDFNINHFYIFSPESQIINEKIPTYSKSFISNFTNSPNLQYLLLTFENSTIQIRPVSDLKTQYISIQLQSILSRNIICSLTFDNKFLISCGADGSLFTQHFDGTAING